jgi:hypothetical protein
VLRQTDPFVPDKIDVAFALLAYVLSFLFVRWVLISWQGWGVSLFTVLYGAFVTTYLRRKNIPIHQESWFWLGILQLTGLSYALWQANGLKPWRELLLFCTAVYWVLSATGMTLLKTTSDWLPLDFLHGLVAVPFRNLGSQYKSMAAAGLSGGYSKKKFWSIGLGVILALLVVVAVLPLLIAADSGGFAAIARWMMTPVRRAGTEGFFLFLQIMFAIPTAAYIFALVAGSAHRRGNSSYKQDGMIRLIESLRVLPETTVLTMLGLISGLYLVFIFSQVPYFFSAFTGVRPEGWQVYSEYARNGFFELVRIAIINLSVLAAANLGIDKDRRESLPIKALNCLLTVLTLLLIATALSKMALYIGAYGLSMKRLLPCILMIFLAVVCGGVIFRQRRPFSVIRFAALTGAVMLCALSLVNPDAYVANYNADRYMAGTLRTMDVVILHRAGPAALNAALRIYGKGNDHDLQRAVQYYLDGQQRMSAQSAGTVRDTLENALARKKMTWHLGTP